MSLDNRPNPELWVCYMQYIAADGVTPVTEVALYEGSTPLDRKYFFNMRPVDGLLMARAHVLAVLATMFAASEADLPDDKDLDGDVQHALPRPPDD